jgi:hypothetical protein
MMSHKMGMNIGVVKITGETTEEQDWWDSTRYTGDEIFISENDFINQTSEPNYFRPNDFEKTINFVKEKIEPEGNKERLLNVLLKMQEDQSMFFYVSW